MAGNATVAERPFAEVRFVLFDQAAYRAFGEALGETDD
jgi:hypothetical protein